ncbi:conserved hypothetical protein [delta proteobacterium NaphS2]|nr:conserved hypothetical protein [delta proteobacterium NaphS2]
MMKLITWEMDRSKTPDDPEERMKLTMAHCEMVKEGMDSGRTKAWGMNPGGEYGFAVSDADEKEIFAMLAQYIPHVKFKVESMLSIDELIAILKAAQEKA